MDAILDAIMEGVLEVVGEIVGEIVGNLLENIFYNIKNSGKRKWALTCFYSGLALIFDGFLLWPTISFLQDENHLGAAVLGGFTVLATVIFGFLIIRGHRRNWQSVKKPSP